MEEHKAEMEV